MWQHLRRPHSPTPLLDNEEDIARSSFDTLIQDSHHPVEDRPEEQYLMSGALPNDDLCSRSPHREPCKTGSCSTIEPKKSREIIKRKPVPVRSPSNTLSDRRKRPISALDIQAAVNTFSKEVDVRFLSPTGQSVLQLIKHIAESPSAPTSVLVELGKDDFWMNARDAEILDRLAGTTCNLGMEHKKRLLRDLTPLVGKDHKYPLRQVLFHGVKIKKGRVRWSLGSADEEGISSLAIALLREQAEDDGSKALVPPPLRIRKSSPDDQHRAHILSPLTEVTEPFTPANRLQAIGLGITNGQVVGTEQRQSGDQVVTRAVTSRPPTNVHDYATKALPKTPAPASESAEDPAAIQHGLSTSTSAAALVIQAAAAARTAAAVPLESSTEASGDAVRLDKPGSVRHARQTLFENPRAAPQPPPSSQHNDSPRSSLRQPGSVKKARLAAEESRRSSGLSGPVPQSLTPDNVLQALARARVARWAKELPSPESVIPPGEFAAPQTSDVVTYATSTEQAKDTAVARPANVPPPRSCSLPRTEPTKTFVLRTQQLRQPPPNNSSCLRGGGPAFSKLTPPPVSEQSSRSKVSTLLGRVTPLEDHERPHARLWYLTGGRSGGKRRVPTAGELRRRKEVEDANRDAVGFIGTVFGRRAVRRVKPEVVEGEDSADEAKGKDGEDEAEGKKGEKAEDAGKGEEA